MRRWRFVGLFRAVCLSCCVVVLVTVSPSAWADTFTVTTVADTDDPNDGFVSLREAINAANQSSTVDVIQFDIDDRLLGPPPHVVNANPYLHGLHFEFTADGSEIRGLSVHHF